MQLSSGQKILFIGDSITDCGRRGAEAPLGNGYVKFFTMLMTARQPQVKLEYVNQGIGGNRVTHLQERWADDVLSETPDLLSINVGINDLYSYLSGAADAVDPQRFASVYDDLLIRTKDALSCPIVLIDPFFISTGQETDAFPSQVLAHLPRYIDTVHELSAKYGTMLVKTHEMFQRHLRHNPASVYCPEPVHPNSQGHLLIAEALYDVVVG